MLNTSDTKIPDILQTAVQNIRDYIVKLLRENLKDSIG